MPYLTIIGPHPGGKFNDSALAQGVLQTITKLLNTEVRYIPLAPYKLADAATQLDPLTGDTNLGDASQLLVISTLTQLQRQITPQLLATSKREVPKFLFLLLEHPFIDPTSLALLEEFDVLIVQDVVCKAALLQALSLVQNPSRGLYSRIRSAQVINVGIDTNFWTPPDSRHKEPNKTELRQLLWNGSVKPDNTLFLVVEPYSSALNLPQIIHLFSALKRRQPGLKPKLYLHVHGMDTSEKQNMATIVAGNDLELGVDIIHQERWLEAKALRHLYHASDVYLNLKLMGALDFSTMEALSCGLVVACTDDFIRSKYTENNLGIPLPAVNFDRYPGRTDNLFARTISPCTAADTIATKLTPESQQKMFLNTQAWRKNEANSFIYGGKELTKIMGLL